MIKYFRKIRQHLISEKKVQKYLLYAIGEIILVVIGILIALMLNTRKELHNHNTQIKGFLTSISENLSEDMKAVDEWFEWKDESLLLSEEILQKQLTATDYESKKFRDYINLTTGTLEVTQFEKNAYSRLMDHIEFIPEKYTKLIGPIQQVYEIEIPITTRVLNDIKIYKSEIEDKIKNKYPWYSLTDSIHQYQQIQYYLNSPEHFNDVKRIQKHLLHLHNHLQILRTEMIIAYNMIYTSLPLSTSFSENIEKYEFAKPGELTEYLGKYLSSNSEQMDDTLSLGVGSDKSYLRINDDTAIVKKVKDSFQMIHQDNIQLNFNRDQEGNILSFEIVGNHRDSIRREMFKKIK